MADPPDGGVDTGGGMEEHGLILELQSAGECDGADVVVPTTSMDASAMSSPVHEECSLIETHVRLNGAQQIEGDKQGTVSSLVGFFDRNKAGQASKIVNSLGDDGMLDHVEAQPLHICPKQLMEEGIFLEN